MNAFKAAEKAGRAADLQKELEGLFESQNNSVSPETTSIPATFLRVTVRVSWPDPDLARAQVPASGRFRAIARPR